MGRDDDDREAEWARENARTIATGAPLDAVPDTVASEVTKPHDVGPMLQEAREAGCRACYEEGHDDAEVALRSFLYERGKSDAEVDETVAGMRGRFLKL